ncbi:MAG: hypothetical protein ACI9IP_003325 [Arcticibacterium sp.]
MELPVFRITTENKTPVNSKDIYQNASLTIDGDQPFTGYIEIRGRGNTTWGFPKKPFKIRLHEKTSLLNGLPAKKWILLANYLDPSLMQNAVAMKIGHLLQMPFTNTIEPIELWLNNVFLGNYMLTEQVEAKENRVDVGKEGVLLSLDTGIEPDENNFESSIYKLPIIIKHPKEKNDPRLETVEQDFNELEKRINSSDFPDNNYLELFDGEQMAKYLIVYTLTCNEEINHPKSTYIHKKLGGKFTMGPIWDFDWAFSYEQSHEHYINPRRPLFWERNSKGKIFFKRIVSDPQIRALMKTQWQIFRSNNYNKLLDFVDSYAASIESSREADFKKWGRGEADFNVEKEDLKNWLVLRANYMDDLVEGY